MPASPARRRAAPARPRRPLFVTRKFPPSVGGMETLALGVWRTLSASVPGARLVSHGGSNRALPWWLPLTALRVAGDVVRRRSDFVLCGDAVVCAFLTPLLRALRVPHATMVMGLDLTYDNRLYRAVVHPVLRRAPQVLAISEATAAAARAFGVGDDRVAVVRLGVHAPEVSAEDRSGAREDLLRVHTLPPDAVVVLTLGRLVRRKGVRWFVEEVLPRLPEQVHYVVAGDGEEREAIGAAAARARVPHRVHLLGRVDDDERERLLRGADVFVQPNVPVPGDMEGFGLVTIEAGMRGTPVVASALEGILDAVVDGVTGRLVAPGDASAWVEALSPLVTDREEAARRGAAYGAAARERYGEAQMGTQLASLLGLARRSA